MCCSFLCFSETVEGVRQDRPEREGRTSHAEKEETAQDVKI